MTYTVPPEGRWIPLKIVDADLVVRELKVVEGGEICYWLVNCFRLRLEHVDTSWGERGSPYCLEIPVFDYEVPHDAPRADEEIGFVKTSGTSLLRATKLPEPNRDLTYREELSLPGRLIGKEVMGQVWYRRLSAGFSDEIRDDLLPVT